MEVILRVNCLFHYIKNKTSYNPKGNLRERLKRLCLTLSVLLPSASKECIQVILIATEMILIGFCFIYFV